MICAYCSDMVIYAPILDSTRFWCCYMASAVE